MKEWDGADAVFRSFVRLPAMDGNLSLLFAVNLVFALCSSMVNPLFPLFIQDLGGSILDISLLLFLGQISSVVLMIPSGLLSDRYGKRTMTMLSLVMQGISALFLSMSKTWVQTIPATIAFMGSFGVFMPPRMAYVADSTSQKTRATGYGVMNLAWPLGMVPGPFLAGYVSDSYGWSYCFYIVVLVSFLSLVPALRLKKTRGGAGRRERKHGWLPFTQQISYLLAVFFLIQFFGNIARGVLRPVVPLYLTDSFRLDKVEVGLFFSIGLGVATLVAQIPAGMIADRYGRKRTMVYAISIIPLLSVLWPWLNSYVLLAMLYMSITGLWSVTWPASTAYLMDMAPTERRATAVTIRQAAIGLGFTVGPVIGGYLWEMCGPATTFYSSALFFALSLLLVFLLKE